MLRHNCGWSVAHSLHDAYSFVRSLQHRGREATGIAAISRERIDVVKWKGEVRRFDVDDLHEIFPGHNYDTFFSHVRYATRGRKDKLLEDAHPHVLGGKMIDREDHVFFLDCDAAIVINGQTDDRYFNGIDLNLVRGGCDTEKLLHYYRQRGLQALMREVPGAYSGAIADRNNRGVFVFRDRFANRPGALGWKDGKYVAASEDIAFKENGGEVTEDLMPGYVYILSHNGDYKKEKIIEPENPAHCMFCWNYLAKRNSILDGIGVGVLRRYLGEECANEFLPEGLDFVSFVPRCPGIAAASYHRKTGIPFKKVFYKMRGERSFQGSNIDERADSINSNLHLSPHIGDSLRDKVGLFIEDSIVRGNVMRRVKHLLYEEAKMRSAYIISYTPPIGVIGSDGVGRYCDCGVDMPEGDDFIARRRNNDEISRELGLSVNYLSIQGFFNAFKRAGMPSENLCTFCIGGEHPFHEVTIRRT